MPELLPVQQQLAELLQAGRTIAVRWDCGGDESWVTTEVDGQEIALDYEKQDTDFGFLLDRYLTEQLELPDAGDFSMQGGGRIFQEGADVVIEYQSAFSETGDEEALTDEEWREMGLDPAEWRTAATPPADSEATRAPADDSQSADAYYSGRRVLFTLP